MKETRNSIMRDGMESTSNAFLTTEASSFQKSYTLYIKWLL